MKNAQVFLALLAVLLGTFGCEKKNPAPQAGGQQQSNPQTPTAPAKSQPSGTSTTGNGSSVKSQAPAVAPATQSVSDTVIPWSELRRTCRYIVVDGSGSMKDPCDGGKTRKIDDAKAALKTFIENLPADDNVGLFVFDDNGTREVVPLGTGSGNRAKLLTEVQAISATSAGTPLGASINIGIDALKAQAAKQYNNPELFLTVVTDGVASDEGVMQSAVKRAKTEGIPIITIGFCIGQDHSLRKGSMRYLTAQDQKSLENALQKTLDEID